MAAYIPRSALPQQVPLEWTRLAGQVQGLSDPTRPAPLDGDPVRRNEIRCAPGWSVEPSSGRGLPWLGWANQLSHRCCIRARFADRMIGSIGSISRRTRLNSQHCGLVSSAGLHSEVNVGRRKPRAAWAWNPRCDPAGAHEPRQKSRMSRFLSSPQFEKVCRSILKYAHFTVLPIPGNMALSFPCV